MSRPQVFGTVAGGDLANEKRCGFVRIKLEDGHVLTIPATDEQVQGFKFGGEVRLPVMPTTTKTIAKLRIGGVDGDGEGAE
jgi:hypothetical protein